MSTAATDVSAVHDTAADRTEEVAPYDGDALPAPGHEPMAGSIAFMMATMGSVATVFFVCFAIVSVGRGASLSLWATAASTVALVWICTMLAALWSSETRGEWG